MHLCVLGNSHISALKRAWDATPPRGVTATFFGSTSQMLRQVELHGRTLRPTTPRLRTYFLRTAGQPKIRLSDYDAFLLAGLGLGVVNTAKIYETHRLPEHCDDHMPISRAALDQAAYEMLLRLAAKPLIRLIRRISAAPIMLIPEPFPSAGAQQAEPWWAAAELRAVHAAVFDIAIRRFAKEMGVDFLPQPPGTLEANFTKAEYRIGAVDALLDFTYRSSDYRHMNDAYGLAVWQEVRLPDGEKLRSEAPALV